MTRRRAGIVLLDALIATVILLVAALAYASSTVWHHRANAALEARSLATETLGRFVERLRADPDWVTLYARLRPLACESAGPLAASTLGADAGLPCHPASTYYPDFTVPSALAGAEFLVQVPVTTVAGAAALREDAVLPRYGLPSDLNGDGVVDASPRDDDYMDLPVVVRLRWRRAGQGPDEVVLATWLRGER